VPAERFGCGSFTSKSLLVVLDTGTCRIPEPAIEGDVARLIDERHPSWCGDRPGVATGGAADLIAFLQAR
jgi:hypothetical protein